MQRASSPDRYVDLYIECAVNISRFRHVVTTCPLVGLLPEPKQPLIEMQMSHLRLWPSRSIRARGTHSLLSMVDLNPRRIKDKLPCVDVTVMVEASLFSYLLAVGLCS